MTPRDTVLDTGLRWLFDTVQPDDAHQHHLGISINLPAANRVYGFYPSEAARGGGQSVVTVDVGKVERDEDLTPLNPLGVDELASLAANLEARGLDLRQTWNGHPGVTGSVGLARPPHPTLVAAVQRYRRGCTEHPKKAVFCDCQAWRAEAGRIVNPGAALAEAAQTS